MPLSREAPKKQQMKLNGIPYLLLHVVVGGHFSDHIFICLFDPKRKDPINMFDGVLLRLQSVKYY